ncbi:uncharacterized protein LOC136082785 [Hydra vulgaris]|uniref:Uncharacterized protein LOC136082785 n=1 Tax=Hydra vulgaris TaxID=6087 RepID=A0ABM4C9D8_HYDVU
MAYLCLAPTDVPVPYLNTSVRDSNIIPLQIYPASNIHGLIDHYELFVIDIKISSVLSSSINSANFACAKDHRYRRYINNNTENFIKQDIHVAALFNEDELPKLFKLGDGLKDNRKLIGGHYYSTFLHAYVKSKCEQYWPDHGSEIYGTIIVELKSELKLCNDCIRTFEFLPPSMGKLGLLNIINIYSGQILECPPALVQSLHLLDEFILLNLLVVVQLLFIVVQVLVVVLVILLLMQCWNV